MYIKSLAENLVQKALLLFEILSFEVYCTVDQIATPRLNDTGSRFSNMPENCDSPYQRYAESATLRINDMRSRRLPVSLSRESFFKYEYLRE